MLQSTRCASPKWAMTRACLWERARRARWRGQEGRGCLSEHEASRGSSRWKRDALCVRATRTDSRKHSLPRHSLLRRCSGASFLCVTLIVFATYAKYLLFQGTFYRQARAPPAAFFCVCLRAQGMEEGGENKTKVCCQLQRVPPPGCGCRIATIRQIQTLSLRTSWGVGGGGRTVVLQKWVRKTDKRNC